MNALRPFWIIAPLLILAVLWPGVSVAEPGFDSKAAAWTRTLDSLERRVRAGDADDKVAARHRVALEDVRAAAVEARAMSVTETEDVGTLLKALGAPPAEGKPAELATIAAKRKDLETRLAAARAEVAQADLTLSRIQSIVQIMTAKQRRRVVEHLLTQHPIPFLPETAQQAVPELLQAVTAVAQSPVIWFEGLSAKDRGKQWRPALVILLAFLLAWGLRTPILRYGGPSDAIENPTYGRRLIAAAAIAAARGIVPAAVIGGAYVWFNRPNALVSGLFADTLNNLLINLLIFVVAMATMRAVLSPRNVTWRLTDLTPDAVQSLARWSLMLIALFTAERFLAESIASRGVSQDLESFFGFLITVPEVTLIACLLLPNRLWTLPMPSATPEYPVVNRPIGQLMRRSVVIVAVLALLAVAMGYVILGRFVIEGMIVSSVVVAPLVLIHRFAREGIARMARIVLARSRREVQTETGDVTTFWLNTVADVTLIAAASVPLALIWQIPTDGLREWLRAGMEGFTVGAITISPTDILIALLVFFGVMVLTRLLQRLLLDRVLPQMQVEVSVRHSIATGIGYLGAILAVAFGIGAAGIDLTNLALVAGALSVGIGFGLQSIVNNLVSGFILLFERPIKVGDWIIVGDKEGLVKKISFRATEIETWQRASVIVPNGELLTTAVTNWTHSDRRGRVEVPVGVAYGSDVEKVREILLACADEHDRVLKDPPPWVLFMNFGNSSLDFELRCFTNDVMRRMGCASDLRFAIDKRFREEGIEIPFPQHVVHMAPPPDKD